MRIVLIDDDELDCLLAQRAFEKSGFVGEFVTIHNGEEALKYLSESALREKDLILLDVNMPGMNGFEVLSALRANKTLTSLPIVMLSSSEAKHDVERAYRLGAFSYVAKPSSMDRYRQVASMLTDYWFSTVQLATNQ